MKVLLLCPSFYSLHTTLIKGFESLGHQVKHHDYRLHQKNWQNKVNVQVFRLPFSYRRHWEEYYFRIINEKHREVFDNMMPDIVFIYNNEGLLPETVQYFKNNHSKIIFILGDSPYYTFTNPYYLHLLFMANLIVSPDSMWAEQLSALGISNIIIDFPGYDEQLMNSREPVDAERSLFNFDIFFLGTGYPDAWGYKRTLFVSKFSNLNLKVFGTKHWLKWLEFFPELKLKFELNTDRISDEQLMVMSKCAKVYPVDANPGLLNGLHLRVFDCIATGVLPLVEYRKDHETFFKGVNLPLIKNFNDAESMAKTYIENQILRETTLHELRDYVFTRFRSSIALKRILEKL